MWLILHIDEDSFIIINTARRSHSGLHWISLYKSFYFVKLVIKGVRGFRVDSYSAWTKIAYYIHCLQNSNLWVVNGKLELFDALGKVKGIRGINTTEVKALEPKIEVFNDNQVQSDDGNMCGPMVLFFSVLRYCYHNMHNIILG